MPAKTTQPSRARKAPPPPARRNPDRVRDAWGLGLIVVGLLAGLGLYWQGSAGMVGMLLTGIARGLFGSLGLAVPVALVTGGLLLLSRRPKPGREAAGAAVALVGVLGLWHLTSGAPAFDAGAAALQVSGGWVGAAAALPLRAVAASAGAVVLLVGLVGAGLMLASATPPRVLARAVLSVFVADAETAARRRARRAERLAAREARAVSAPPADAEEPPDHTDWEELAAQPPPKEQTLPLTDITYEGLLDDGKEPEPTPAAEPAKPLEVTQPLARKVRPGADDWSDYRLPSLALLRGGRAAVGNRRLLEQMTHALERTLQQFDVDARVAKVSRGPTVTRFEVELVEGTKVSAVTRLADDFSYALATPDIRIVAPIPGKSAIGIEVPNRDRDLITLGDVLRSPEAQAETHPLAVGIGKDIAGQPVMVNLAKMPHLLIGGATGSGKSVTMNAIVTSLITRATPAEVRMILIDPKRVELNIYEDVPHLLTRVVTDPKRAKDALDWAVAEMERRYEVLALYGHRNLDGYNDAVRAGTLRTPGVLQIDTTPEPETMPYIVVVIDELADLMMVAPRDVESAICRIAQMARAVGIHLIVATQRPSVNVVTGLIKANIPARIALAMATGHDSKTILDSHGAEKLVGQGDMLFLPANASKPHRVQGCLVQEREIEQIVERCKAQRSASYTVGVVKEGEAAITADALGDDADDADLVRAAMDLVVRSGLGSTSMLQRKLKVGFARAGRLMDELEQRGVVGPSEGPKARNVLITVEELDARL